MTGRPLGHTAPQQEGTSGETSRPPSGDGGSLRRSAKKLAQVCKHGKAVKEAGSQRHLSTTTEEGDQAARVGGDGASSLCWEEARTLFMQQHD